MENKRTCFNRLLVGAAISAVTGAAHADPPAGSDLSEAATAGAPAAGVGGGSFFDFAEVQMASDGQLLFSTSLSGTAGGSLDNSGIYLWDDDAAPIALVRENDPSPDGNGAFENSNAFYKFSFIDGSNIGLTAELRNTTGGSSDDGGVFIYDGVSWSTLIREGEPSPSGGGATITPIPSFPIYMNGVGEVAFFASTSTFTPGWFGGDLTNGVSTIHFPGGNSTARYNDAGQFAVFTNNFAPAGTWRFEPGGGSTQIAVMGDALGGGDTVFVASLNDMNAGGVCTMKSSLNGGTSESALLRGDGTTLDILVRDGDALPDGGLAIIGGFSRAFLNDAGNVAAILSDDSLNEVILSSDGVNPFVQIARSGQDSPTGNGAYDDLDLLAINADGQVLFSSTLSGTSDGADDNKAMFLWNGAFVQELVRKGDSVSTFAGSKAIADIFPTRNLSDDGSNYFAFIAAYTDGTEGVVRGEPKLNNDFDAALALTSGVPVIGDFALAENNQVSTCDPDSVDLFYQIAINSGPADLNVNTCGSTTHTALAVYDAGQTEIACNNDCSGSPCAGPDACISLSGLAAGTYFVRVSADAGALAGSAGSTQFNLVATVTGGGGACCLNDQTCEELSFEDCAAAGGFYQGDQSLCANVDCFNDDCADALAVSDGLTPFSTIGATTDGPSAVECEQANDSNGQTFSDIWYTYEASCTGVLTVSTCEDVGGSADYDTDIKIYEGSDCGSLTSSLLGCNDDDLFNPCGVDNFRSVVQVPVTAGQTYLIRVGGWGGASDVGGGMLYVDCDATDRACCLTDGSCAVIAPADCLDAGGVYQESSSDCTANLCASDECAADFCQPNNNTGFVFTSDLSTDFQIADDYTPTQDVVVNSVCWWGIYVDFTPSFNPCGAGEGDQFQITYYTGTPPTTIAHGPFIGNMVSKTPYATLGSFQEYEFRATHPAVQLLADTTYWVEIVNLVDGDCDWTWTASVTDSGTVYADDEPGASGYDSGDAAVGDMAFCLGFGDFAGACCFSDGSCTFLGEVDCGVQGGVFQGAVSNCLQTVCEEPPTCDADITSDAKGPNGGDPDNVVDTFDLLMLLAQWSTAGPEADIASDPDGPFAGAPDGVVDTFDLLLLLEQWGACD